MGRSYALFLFSVRYVNLDTNDPKAIYQHAAECGEFLNWETTPVFTYEEDG